MVYFGDKNGDIKQICDIWMYGSGGVSCFMNSSSYLWTLSVQVMAPTWAGREPCGIFQDYVCHPRFARHSVLIYMHTKAVL